MKNVSGLLLIILFVFLGCGNVKTEIKREFITLKLGMNGDEYRAGGWHDGFSKTGKIETIAYSGKGGIYREISKDWERGDNALELRYPDDLKNVKEINCIFYNDKLCVIQIAWYTRGDVSWDTFSQRTIDKYGQPQKSTVNSYSWDDGQTTLQIHKDYSYETSITRDLNTATYIDNKIHSQMKENQKQSSPEL